MLRARTLRKITAMTAEVLCTLELPQPFPTLVSSRVYQLSDRVEGDDPGDKHFARASLRPLTPQQYALSLFLVTGDGSFEQTGERQARDRRYRDLEGQGGRLTKLDLLDPRSERYQSSTGEALFTSNHPEIQRLVAPVGIHKEVRSAAWFRHVRQMAIGANERCVDRL